MRIILKENVTNLGKVGDIVTVKPGYGRNLLIPFGKAARATKENIELIEAHRVELEKKEAEKLAKAQERADQLKELTLKILAKASEEGKLFGSVTAREIVTAALVLGVELDKNEVRLPEGPLRQTGEYEINIALHHQVSTVVKVVVEMEA